MIFLPENPCCTTNPLVNTVPCTGGDACTTQLVASQYVAYSGPNLPCTGIQTCDTLTVALQKVDEEVCDLQNEILILQNLVNSLITTTTTTSTSSTTTTTTTIACPSCTFYSVSNETITPAEITYYACGGILTNAVVGAFGTIYVCACTGTLVIPPVPGVSSVNLGACPTTTTTTTAAPVECFCYTINNPTEGSIFMTWTRCSDGVLLSQSVAPGGTFYRCSRTPVTGEGLVITGGIDPCATDFDCIP